jgi:hypothetical protein
VDGRIGLRLGLIYLREFVLVLYPARGRWTHSVSLVEHFWQAPPPGDGLHLILSLRHGSHVLRRPEVPVEAWVALLVVGMMTEGLVTLYAPLGAVGVLLREMLVL